MPPAYPAHDPVGCRQMMPHRRGRHRDYFPAHTRQRDARAARDTRLSRQRGIDLFGRLGAEERLDCLAKLARERECDTDARLVLPRLDRAERLPGNAGAQREFVLAESARGARAPDFVLR